MTRDDGNRPPDKPKSTNSGPPPLPSDNVAKPRQGPDSTPRLFKFGQVLGGLIAVIGAALAEKSAGWTSGQILISIACIIIVAATANDAYLVLKNKIRRSKVVVQAAACIVALVFLVLEFYGLPFGPGGAGAKPPQAVKQTSCDTSTLLSPPAVTPDEASSPLIYKVVSTPTRPGDQTAVAHEIYPSGWIQQVFLATRSNIATVSAIISTQFRPQPDIIITFQIRTLTGRIIRSIDAKYDGSTNNKDFGNSVGSPLPIKPGDLYVLRVINNSPKSIYIYAHYYDRAQVVPYEVPACAYNSGDGGPQYFTMQDNRGIQVLSGFIESSGT